MILQWVQHEKKEFLDHHRSTMNILLHLVCGILYMSGLILLISRLCCSLCKQSKQSYSIWVLWWIVFYGAVCIMMFPESWFLMMVMILALQYTTSFHFLLSMSSFKLFLFSSVFYMLPDTGHFISKESTVLSIHNVTIPKIISNIFLLLPFSLQCLAIQWSANEQTTN